MGEEISKYIRCRNCGNYIEENQSISKLYCSEECAGSFTRCPNCGSFFNTADKDRYKGFCSRECEAVYDDEGIIVSSGSSSDGDKTSSESLNNNSILKEEQK